MKMPTTPEILAGLTTIANEGLLVAVAWHFAIATAIVWIVTGWRPTRRAAAVLMATPLVSVAAFAFAYGNPFNGAVFALGALALVILGLTARAGRVQPGPRWATAIGVAMVAYAWAYPHFLDGGSPIVYLFAAPVGLVPCPTVALVIGLSLLAGGVNRRVAGVVALLGLFYGGFGAARLGVLLDLGLIVGAIGLAVLAVPRISSAGASRLPAGAKS
jgi:hypothetical protein